MFYLVIIHISLLLLAETVFVLCLQFHIDVMTAVLLSVNIIVVFCFTAFIHFHYGNWQKHHILVTLTTFVSWYFPFMIVCVMPIDVSNVSITDCDSSLTCQYFLRINDDDD